MGDVGGFRHDNLDTAPKTVFTAPVFTTTHSIDYAERTPKVIVRAGDFTDDDRPNDSHVAFSTDGGATWFQGTAPNGVNSGGTIAAAAASSGRRETPVVSSVGYGTSWTASNGVPANAIVAADRVNPMKFYAYSNGTFHVSNNGGTSFAASAAAGQPASSAAAE
jgi:xyloglucan-specific exo-beta-1,4-glucanase